MEIKKKPMNHINKDDINDNYYDILDEDKYTEINNTDNDKKKNMINKDIKNIKDGDSLYLIQNYVI